MDDAQHRERADRHAAEASRRAGKPTREGNAREGQRSRLLTAIVAEAVHEGYPATKIGRLAGRAGVSRATFYEQFESKEACLLTAHAELADRMCSTVGQAVSSEDSNPEHAAVEALVAFAGQEPEVFSFLTHEAMLAGPRGLKARDGLITALGSTIDDAWETARHVRAPTPDLSAKVLLGGVIRLLGIQMRRGDAPGETSLQDVVVGLDYCDVLSQAQRWSGFTTSDASVAPNENRLAAAPQPLPRGRHRLPAGIANRVQRERILHATAEAIRAKGYSEITVADIVAGAGLSREAFYNNFADKQEAFEATHRLVFEQFVAASAGAFYMSSSSWPERVWDGGRAFTNLVASVPSFAHVGFVECYALGPAFAQSVDDGLMAFTLFLDEGCRYRPEAADVPRMASQLIAGIIMETASFFVREGRAREVPGLLPLFSYMILAPFTGPDAARELVDEKVREAEAAQACAGGV